VLNRFTSRVCHCARLTPSSKLTKGAFLRGRKTIILNAPALAVLNGLERIGPYVVPGVDPEQPRHDLKRLWDAVTKRAGVTGVRLHDYGIPMQASVPVVDSVYQSLAACLDTLSRRPPHAVRISITTRFDRHR
jgi:hypothetical protein